MSYLFEIYNQEVRPKPTTLLIEPFKTIWERDKSNNKQNAISDLSYIEFMSSVKKSNPYHGYPEEIRKEKLIQDLYISKHLDSKPDSLCNEGIKLIDEFQSEASVSYSYYLAAKKAVEVMKDFYNNVDLNAKNKSGMPLYKPADLTKALNDTEKVIQNLNALKKKVDEEMYESNKTKGNKEISPFANPNSLNKFSK